MHVGWRRSHHSKERLVTQPRDSRLAAIAAASSEVGAVRPAQPFAVGADHRGVRKATFLVPNLGCQHQRPISQHRRPRVVEEEQEIFCVVGGAGGAASLAASVRYLGFTILSDPMQHSSPFLSNSSDR